MEQTTLERRVRVIPATRPANRPNSPRRSGKQRVAAYCRVSTNSEEQLNSYPGADHKGAGCGVGTD